MRRHVGSAIFGRPAGVLRRLPRRFTVREDGSITIFATVVFVLMVGIGGIAIDVMRFETQRVQLQYTLDRAVLAAASLSQTLDPEEVVQAYFETAGLEGYRLRVQVEEGVNFRRVEAQAELDLQTLFMSIFGQPILTSPAAGAAEERVRNIEVSLVLDISGSMLSANRLENLRPAAREFVTSVLAANDNPNNEQLVSVSIVPYDHAVNMGTTLSSVFALTNEHSYSRCARFYEADFAVSGINPTVPLQRLGHFDYQSGQNGNFACRTDNRGAVAPWSNNESQLHALINGLSTEGNRFTAIDQGMRWAVALLDPAARPALSALVANGTVHEDFTGRPASYLDPETIKIVVLMTDGENTRQWDVHNQYRSGPSPFWRDPDNGDLSIYRASTNRYWQVDNDVWRTTPDGGSNDNAVRIDYADLWNYVPTGAMYNLLRYEPDSYIQGLRYSYEFSDIVNEHTPNNGLVADTRLRTMCDVAHAQGIVVFSIAFEAPSGGQSVMRYCASSDAHFYDVDGIDISNAFASIARTINQLRLIQ
jgi:Flp pilus assembly protein TadG